MLPDSLWDNYLYFPFVGKSNANSKKKNPIPSSIYSGKPRKKRPGFLVDKVLNSLRIYYSQS